MEKKFVNYGRQINTYLSLHNLNRLWLKLALEFSGLRPMWTEGPIDIFTISWYNSTYRLCFESSNVREKKVVSIILSDFEQKMQINYYIFTGII